MPAKNKKRPANSPSGSVSKEMKNATPTGLESLPSVPVPVATPMSFAAATAAGLSITTTTVPTVSGSTIITTTTSTSSDYQNLDDKSVFKTQEPEGGFRDEIIVGIDTIDDEPYRGTITVREAVREIFIGIMEFNKEALASVSIGYNKGRIVTFKLVNKFDIDQLASIEFFSFTRQGQKKDGSLFDQKLGCKIRGIRKPNLPSHDHTDFQTRWVKIEGCEYRVEKAELMTWMNYLGDTITEITEDRINLDEESGSDEENPGFSVGTGIYSVKMRITRDLPQFVPICGKRIRLYYRDIPKVCTQCFGRHPRKGCLAQKVPWVKYVSEFMHKYAYIPKESYGKWGKIVDEWRISNESQDNAETNQNKHPEMEAQPGPESSADRNEEEIVKGADQSGVSSETNLRPHPGALGMEITVASKKPDKGTPDMTDPVGNALHKLRSLGINTSTVTLNKQPKQTGDEAIKTTRQSAAAPTRGRKNSY